jgi:hypothetical protein
MLCVVPYLTSVVILMRVVVRIGPTGNEIILARKMDERHLGLHPAGGKVGGGEFGLSGLEGLEGI